MNRINYAFLKSVTISEGDKAKLMENHRRDLEEVVANGINASDRAAAARSLKTWQRKHQEYFG